MSDYIEVMPAEALEDGSMTEVEIDGHPLLVARVDGTYYISDGRCPHMHGPLPKGELNGTIVTCPWHHSQFDLTDGHVVRWTDWKGSVKSMSEAIRHPRPLRVYEVMIEGGKIWVGDQKEPPATS